MDDNVLVFSILGVAFAAVGVHLYFYSRRLSRRIRNYAARHGLDYHAADRDNLETRLNETFDLPETGLVQNFGRIKDVVHFDGGVLFRTVELLDLNPYASASNPHNARAAVLFDCSGGPEGIFSISPTLEVRQRYPLEGEDKTNKVAELFRGAGAERLPHPLSISLADGRAVAYLEPLVAGSMMETDLDYLIGLAGRLRRSG